MAVTAVQNESVASVFAGLSAKSSATKTNATSEMSDRFLKLLVTQLRNQDPMNPMENAELTTQLAQMSTVEGVNNLNATMDGLVSQFKSSQIMQGRSGAPPSSAATTPQSCAEKTRPAVCRGRSGSFTVSSATAMHRARHQWAGSCSAWPVCRKLVG